MEIGAAVVASIKAAAPDHIAMTGDILNLSSPREFVQGRRWLEQLGSPDAVSFVPGNHDAYVKVPWEHGLAAFAPWMKADNARSSSTQFPYLRLRRNIALIGINSACPQALHRAGGKVGERQLRDLSHSLESLRAQGFYRIVMIHHPPLPGLASPRKALSDATALADVLRAAGCELVLHGHNHHYMANWIETVTGPAPVIGAASSTSTGAMKSEPAGWNLFHILRHQGNWRTELVRHLWHSDTGKFQPQSQALLLPP
jgi:3',5'-cyclic AMP phosphodiesterase CpdA